MKLTMYKSVGFFLLLIFFLAFQEEVRQAEAVICSAESNSFRGMCWIHRNCQIACEKDGFLDGNCHGLRRKCICTKPCTAGSGGAGGSSSGAEGGYSGGGEGGAEGGDGGSEGGDGGGDSGGDGGGESSGGGGGEGKGDGGDASPLEV